MTQINQSGSANQASTGNNSPNIQGSKNKINFSKENRKWFFTGILLPVIAGLVIEFIKEGKVSEWFSLITNIFR